MGTGGSFWTRESPGPFLCSYNSVSVYPGGKWYCLPFSGKGSLNYSKHLGIYFLPDAVYGLLGHNIQQFWLLWKFLVFRHCSSLLLYLAFFSGCSECFKLECQGNTAFIKYFLFRVVLC